MSSSGRRLALSFRRGAFGILAMVPLMLGCELLGGIDERKLAVGSGGANGTSSSSDSSSSNTGGCVAEEPCSDCGPIHVDCGGGACHDGVCQGFVLAKATLPTAIAVDDSAVYWNDNAIAHGLYWCNKSNCNAAFPMVSNVPIGPIVANAGFVTFAVDRAPPEGSIGQCASQAIQCAPEGLAKNLGSTVAFDIDVDAMAVYYSDPLVGLVKALPGMKGLPATLATNTNVGAIAVGAKGVFWIDQDTGMTWQCSKSDDCSGGASLVTAPPFLAYPVGLAVRIVDFSAYLFMAGRDMATNREGIFQCDALVAPCQLSKISSFSGHVAAFTVAQQPPSGPQYVYFAPADGANTVSVFRVEVGSDDLAAPVEIARSQASPAAFAQDEQAVYWVDQSSGNIMKAIK